MNKQVTLSAFSDELAQVRTKKKEFLTQIDRIIPWGEWIALTKPHYYKGERGNKPYDLELMLRIYLLQNLYDLSDEGTVAEVIDSRAFSEFCGVDSSNQVPNGDTLGRFRNLLTKNGLQEKFFAQVVSMLMDRGLILKKGTIVDSTIISAPSSTKNKEKKRDPDAHQVKKGNQWYHGMKVHAGVDAGSGYVHTITGTAANVHDIDETVNLLREDDEVCYGDSGYSGVEKRPEIQANEHFRDIEFRTNVRPSSLKISSSYTGINWDKESENRKSAVRCKVEHPFLIVKRQFGYAKVAYRGIAKNMNRFHILFASANLVKCFRAGRTQEFCMA